MPRPRLVYTLKLGLVGEPEPLGLRITKRDAARFEHVYACYEPDEGAAFFVWDSPAGATIAVSLADIQFANVLWDQPINVPKHPGLPETDIAQLRVRGRAPLATGSDTPSELSEFMMGLESDPEPVLTFLDQDGERMWLRSDQLVYFSVPKWMMELGSEERLKRFAATEARAERKEAAERLISEVHGTPAGLRPRRSNGLS